MKKTVRIAPSLLSSDFANMERDIKVCENAGAEILHIDVMDGHFVPNITIGPPVVKSIRNVTNMTLDCHLMIEEPDKYIPDFAKAGADMISVHVEVLAHLHRTLEFIRSFDMKAGIVLNPITPLEYAFNAAEFCDFILLMSVNPGYGGQKFINSFHKRCEQLNKFLIDEGLSHLDIEVDGGVTLENVSEIVESGASIIVSGSGLFTGNLSDNIQEMKEIVNK